MYLCRHLGLSQHLVALKVLYCGSMCGREAALAEALFQSEVLSSYAVNHPNVVKTYAYIREQGFVGFTMEYVSGGTLAEFSETQRPIALGEICDLLGQTCAALDALHSAQVVHGDIKPSNLLLTPSGQLKVTDFGTAHAAAAQSLRARGCLSGTFDYFGPEYLLNGQLDERTDIYAVGLIGYELITGRKPFDAENYIDSLQLRLKSVPIAPRKLAPDCPRALNDIVVRAMARRPEDRFPTARDMLLALTNFIQSRARHAVRDHWVS